MEEIKVFYKEGKPSVELRKDGDKYIMAQITESVSISKDEYSDISKKLSDEGYKVLIDTE